MLTVSEWRWLVESELDPDEGVIIDRRGAAQRMHDRACAAAEGADDTAWDNRDDAAWALSMSEAVLNLY